MGLLRLGAAGVIGGHALLYESVPSHPAPAYVRPATFALAASLLLLALAQMRWRHSRTLAHASLVADAAVAITLLLLYSFDPRGYLFALLISVEAEAAVILGLRAALAVWATATAGYLFSEFIGNRFNATPWTPTAIAIRLAASLSVVLVIRTLVRAIERERMAFLSVLESAPDAVLVTDGSGLIVMANRQAELTFGFPRPELLGRSIDTLMSQPPPDVMPDHAADRSAGAPKETTTTGLELVGERSDGSRFSAEVSLAAFTDEEMLVTNIVRDVTDRKRVEQELSESEERLRLLMEQMPSSIVWSVDPELRFTSSSGAGLAHIGLRPDEVVGMSLVEFFRTDDPEMRSIAAHRRALLGEPVSYAEDRAGRAFDVHLEPLRGPEGEITGVIGLALDVTERRQAEARYRALIETIPAAVYIDRLTGSGPATRRTALYMSPQIGSLLGYSPEQFMTDPSLWQRSLHPEDRDAVIAEDARHYATGEPLTNEYRMIGRDEKTVWIRDQAVVLDEQGDRFSQGVLLDVTATKEAQQDLERSLVLLRRTEQQRRLLAARLANAQEEERRRIAGDIHDDSIQKMTAVGMRLQAMKPDLPEDKQEMLGQLEETVSLAIERLRRLLFELHPPALDRWGLEAALREYVEQTSVEGGPRFSLTNSMASEPSPEIRTIAYRIAQEALANVQKHARATNVAVHLARQDDVLFVSVKDDGIGFDPSAVDQVRPGHLGLESMQERAELAGGRILVQSSPGHGASVELWLPVAAPEE